MVNVSYVVCDRKPVKEIFSVLLGPLIYNSRAVAIKSSPISQVLSLALSRAGGWTSSVNTHSFFFGQSAHHMPVPIANRNRTWCCFRVLKTTFFNETAFDLLKGKKVKEGRLLRFSFSEVLRWKGKPCLCKDKWPYIHHEASVLCNSETSSDAKTRGHFKIILAELGDLEILRWINNRETKWCVSRKKTTIVCSFGSKSSNVPDFIKYAVRWISIVWTTSRFIKHVCDIFNL